MNKNMKKLPEALCQLGNLSCMGCCTSISVRSKKIVENQLIINTKRFKLIKDPEQFTIDSGPDVDQKSDICKSLIREKDKIFCPAHPMSPYTKGEDLRHYCWKGYWCPTMKKYMKWSDEKKLKFIKFIKSKNLDWHSYSQGMDTGSLYEEFSK
jgi:hypothetical protein